MKLELVGDTYSSGKYQLYSQYNLGLKSVLIANDALSFQLTGLAGTNLQPGAGGITFNAKYGGGVLNDYAGFRVQAFIEARKGIPQSVTYGLEGRLKDAATGTDIGLTVQSTPVGRPSVSGSVYIAPTPLFGLKLGFDYDPITNTIRPKSLFSLDW